MTESIVTALITGALTLIGVLIANSKQQAITDTKIEELTREVLSLIHISTVSMGRALLSTALTIKQLTALAADLPPYSGPGILQRR